MLVFLEYNNVGNNFFMHHVFLKHFDSTYRSGRSLSFNTVLLLA